MILPKQIRDWLVAFAVRALMAGVQALRLETCGWWSRVLARVMWDVVRIRRDVMHENLRIAFPDWTEVRLNRTARRMWQHLFLLACEVAHARRKIHETNWTDYIAIPERARLVEHLTRSRSTVVVTGHFGNFEVAGYLLGLLGYRAHTVARTLDNPYLDRIVNDFRESSGQSILPKEGSAGAVEGVLARGETLVLLGDQHAGPKGCWVDFMGRPASCHKAVALFTLGPGAPLVVTGLVRLREKPMQFELQLAGTADPQVGGPEFDGVRSLTQWYNARLEDMIRRAPEQYWWVHRRWKDKHTAPRHKQAAKRRDTPARLEGPHAVESETSAPKSEPNHVDSRRGNL